MTYARGCRIPKVLLFLTAACGVFPAFGQVDLSGYWANRPHEDNMARGPGLEVGEYEGYPLNDAGRMKALSWNGAIYSNRERQCVPLDIVTANSGFRMWKDVDPLTQEEIAWHLRIDYESQDRIIWMDGRPHPPEYAPHTFQGFSTGKWDHNQLVVTTTHLKMNMIERNGQPRSDAATIVEHLIRRGGILTVVHIVYDPVWLEQPFIQTRDFALDLYARVNPSVCQAVDEVLTRPKGYVPFYLPGKNPLVSSAITKYSVPATAVEGGAATMYPEFELKLNAKGANATALPEMHGANLRAAPPLTLPKPIEHVAALQVEGDVYMLVGPGANTTVQIGENGVYVVDPKVESVADELIAAIRQITSKPIRYILNTNADPDHIGGNEPLASSGTALGRTGGGGPQFTGRPTAPIFAHENVLLRVSAPTGAKSLVPTGAWPTETYAARDFRRI